jgi:transposase
MQQDRRLLQTLQTLIEEADEQIHALSIQNPWVKSMPLLLQLPGFAVLNAMTVLAVIGDIQRFPTARQVVSYAGLAPSIHESGQTHRGGRITKEGRRDLRAALVEAAWMAVEHHSHWKAQFERLAHRIGKQKAIVAIARKLLVAIWHILSEEQADRHADIQAVRRKLLAWISRTGITPGKHRAPGTRARLLQDYLQQLGLATEVEGGEPAPFQLSG